MAWLWHFESEDGSPWEAGAMGTASFPNQADAETWLGEAWRDLRSHGVATVRLFEDGREVYGPMPLAPR